MTKRLDDEYRLFNKYIPIAIIVISMLGIILGIAHLLGII